MPFCNQGKDRDTTNMFSDWANQSGGAADLVYQMLRRGKVGSRGTGGWGVVVVNR